nr:hypothetical protein [Kofleriaceae bacterium]
MQKLVESFVGQLSDLYRRAVTDALGGGGGGGGSVRRSRTGRGKGEKRSSDELDGLADKFVDYVHKNPGLRIEQINRELGTSTKDLALPIRKLIAEGVIKGKGEKRSRTYFATEGKRKKG